MNRRPRVVLIEPDINPISRRFGLPLIATYPPLAQIRLAGQIEGADIEIVDFRIRGERRRFLERVRTDPPDLVGISLTFTSNGEEAIAAASDLRRACPATTIVLGGTAPSEEPEAFYNSAADLICFRGGDMALASLVAQIAETRERPASFPGFFHREDGRWTLTPGPTMARPMSHLRPYAWHLLPGRYWRSYLQGFRPAGIGQMSEGCPFDCNFCSVWMTHGRKVSLASLENVKHDFRSLPPLARTVLLADDIFMQGSEKQIRELHDPLLKWLSSDFLPRRMSFYITAETRTDLYMRQEERFKSWIREGRLKWIFFGIEAVTDEQLDNYSKRNTVDTNSEAIRAAARAGASVLAQIVIPCDADIAYFDEIVRFLKAHRPWIRVASFTIATPLPGTVLYEEVLRQSPELADRGVVTHPAFSLFTALMKTKLDIGEFYRQVARVYRVAQQVRFRPSQINQLLLAAAFSPWLISRMIGLPRALRNLTDANTFLEVHRSVQGTRLMDLPRDMVRAGASASAGAA